MMKDANTNNFKKLMFFISDICCLLIMFNNAICRKLLFQCAFHFKAFGEDVQVGDVNFLKHSLHILYLAEMD